jgi:hypothetical protein
MKARRTTSTDPAYWEARTVAAIEARDLVIDARRMLAKAGATNAANACHRAQKSIEGALRNAERFMIEHAPARTRTPRAAGQCPECGHYGIDCKCHRRKNGRVAD